MVKVILKDKKDLNTLKLKGWTKEGYKIVGSQDEIIRDLEVKVLSVKFSKIGQKTFDAYPNLKWIVCRSHGYDNVNIELVKKYNVGIVCTNPNTLQVAQWILDKVKGNKVLVLGGGRIGKMFSKIYKGKVKLITSKTHYDLNIIKDYDTIVISSSPTSKPILTKEILDNFNGGIVSVSRPCCVDNKLLLESIQKGKISYAEMDMLDKDLRENLLQTGKCKYYKHTAWGNDKISFDEKYFDALFTEINLCLKSQSNNVVIDRKPNLFFED